MITENLKTVGLCGGSGAGKGYVCRAFGMLGIPSIDTDAVYRDIVGGGGGDECLSELVREFGREILDGKGALNRRRLATIVFAPGAEQRLACLNSITHKYIFAKTLYLAKEYRRRGAKTVIIDAPVLFESGFDIYCDVKICVSAPEEVRLARICERDGISTYDAAARIARQKSEKELIERCDAVIINDGRAPLNEQVRELATRFDLI